MVRRRWTQLAILSSLALLTACNPPDPVLLGDRESIGRDAAFVETTENVALPIELPAATPVTAWTHPGGNTLHRIPHAAFGSTATLAWSANIGRGDSRRTRINARPVAAEGRVFTVDAQGRVSATSSAGAALWSRDLTPPAERSGQGGSSGLSYGGGKLFVNSGFGEVLALDPSTGTELWVQDIDALGGASATYLDGRLYVAARDSVGWAIDADTGRVDWQINGTPGGSGYFGGGGPAVTDEFAIFPFLSGELVATFRRGGVQRWNASVLGRRPGVAYSRISDLAADPVVAGSTIYAANAA
ncbi:MAG: PQQ-binding-like beta-propeller repeat protein, partial [Pseudomonadota bacterium]